MRWARKLVCRLVGHKWVLKNRFDASWGTSFPKTPEALLWRSSLYRRVGESPQGWVWVCACCGASVPLGQSEGALHG
jgi:hypothetical protein